ncbi:MAG: sulfite exporter TauE/SafE family protein [Chloroflexota bacterium]
MPILVALVIFLGAFTQSLTGFGSALVAMALLPPILGLENTSPLVAGFALGLETLMVIRYRESFKFNSIWRVLAASLIGAPLGVYLLSNVDENIALLILGIVISGYAIYALVGFRLPELAHPLWAWATGLLSGMLGGAYNTSGPPVIIYGNCRRWGAAEFKSNLSGFFVINSLVVTASHFLSGHFTEIVARNFLFAIPAVFVGFLAGQAFDRWIPLPAFRKLVLLLLFVLGGRLIVTSVAELIFGA